MWALKFFDYVLCQVESAHWGLPINLTLKLLTSLQVFTGNIGLLGMSGSSSEGFMSSSTWTRCGDWKPNLMKIHFCQRDSGFDVWYITPSPNLSTNFLFSVVLIYALNEQVESFFSIGNISEVLFLYSSRLLCIWLSYQCEQHALLEMDANAIAKNARLYDFSSRPPENLHPLLLTCKIYGSKLHPK